MSCVKIHPIVESDPLDRILSYADLEAKSGRRTEDGQTTISAIVRGSVSVAPEQHIIQCDG